jgi:hypothetical protein
MPTMNELKKKGYFPLLAKGCKRKPAFMSEWNAKKLAKDFRTNPLLVYYAQAVKTAQHDASIGGDRGWVVMIKQRRK